MLKRKTVFQIILILAIFLPLIISIKPIIEGSIPFWYDPARDLLLAWDNLKKPTLIGPTTGIQGVFYGPFWVWLLSVGLLISKDPRVIDFVVMTIPYFIVFPIILWSLSKKIFNKTIFISLWLFFILSSPYYANQLWSPNLAPLVFLLTFYLIINIDFISNLKNNIRFFILGFIVSLQLSFLFSLAMVTPIALAIYLAFFFIQDLRKKKNTPLEIIKKWFIQIISMIFGLVLGLLPTILFEVRHGFNQFKALANNLTQGYLNQKVLVPGGLNGIEIINEFINRLSSPFKLSNNIFIITIFIIFITIIWKLIKKKTTISKLESRLLIFVFTCCVSYFLIFFTSKNPVFDYRFIGVEIISLLMAGFIAKKIKIIETILLLGSVVYLFVNLYSFINSFNKVNTNSDLSSRMNIVDAIYKDADKKSFAYAAKNAAIYTFDYDYLFKWQEKKYGYFPEKDPSNTKTVYLIIPYELRSDKIGFMENRTLSTKYKTVKEWEVVDRTLIIKREIIK